MLTAKRGANPTPQVLVLSFELSFDWSSRLRLEGGETNLVSLPLSDPQDRDSNSAEEQCERHPIHDLRVITSLRNGLMAPRCSRQEHGASKDM